MKDKNDILIGYKNEFGIQICSPVSQRAKIGLWLGGSLIGNCREEEYLKSIYLQLRKMNYIVKTQNDDKFLENIDIDTLIEKESLFNQVMLNLGVSFDDFIIRVIGNNNFIYFYWKLVPDPFFEYSNYIEEKSQKWKLSWYEYNIVLKKYNQILTSSA